MSFEIPKMDLYIGCSNDWGMLCPITQNTHNYVPGRFYRSALSGTIYQFDFYWEDIWYARAKLTKNGWEYCANNYRSPSWDKWEDVTEQLDNIINTMKAGLL